jgi:hypothetical protein
LFALTTFRQAVCEALCYSLNHLKPKRLLVDDTICAGIDSYNKLINHNAYDNVWKVEETSE